MGKVYGSRADAKTHQVHDGETLAEIAEKYAKEWSTTWEDIALFNWGTVEKAEVNLVLQEITGRCEVKPSSPEKTILYPHPEAPLEFLIPKIGVEANIDLKPNEADQSHPQSQTIVLNPLKPANAVELKKLSPWFLPNAEACDITYCLFGAPEGADKLEMEVWASNYIDIVWQNQNSTIKQKPDICVYHTELKNYQPRQTNQYNEWKGTTNAKEGLLKPEKGNGCINVAFSPYTVLLRHYKADQDKNARLELKPFWPRFAPDHEPIPTSLKLGWSIKNTNRLKQGLLQILDNTETLVFQKPLQPSDLSAGEHSFEWDGKDSTGASIRKEKMPYQLHLQMHTPAGVDNGLALAAMQTEVRLYVHPETLPLDEKDYAATNDEPSLRFSLGPLYPRDNPPPQTARVLWSKMKLAEAGFHPGKVNRTKDESFFKAVEEFKRSVPKVQGQSNTFDRFKIEDWETSPNVDPNKLDISDDMIAALDGLNLGKFKRPWFGKSANRSDYDVSSSEFQLHVNDSQHELIVWVDDRNYYTNPYWVLGGAGGNQGAAGKVLKEITKHPTALGNVGGVFNCGDTRVDLDKKIICRPWIPLKADILLMKKDQKLKDVIDVKLEENEMNHMRKAIGPLRVDWTFDEIDDGNNIASNIDSTQYDKIRTRTKTTVHHVLNKMKKSYNRKDVDKQSTYFNCPETHGGIRPDDLSNYYKAAFSTGDDYLDPWQTFIEPSRESVVTRIYERIGLQENLIYPKYIGQTGIYFRPSIIAGDGYQVRAQIRFQTSNAYSFSNASVLAERYERWPQAHTAKMRVWRKTSLRGYVHWTSDQNQWNAKKDEFIKYYHASYLHFVYEQGEDDVTQPLTSVFPGENGGASFKAAVKQCVPAPGEPSWIEYDTERRKDENIKLDQKAMWPWSKAKQQGIFEPAEPGFNMGDALDYWYEDVISPLWYNYTNRMALEIVKSIEKTKGILRGHTILQFKSSKPFFVQEYMCSLNPTQHRYYFVEDSPNSNYQVGEPCPAPLCKGHLHQVVICTGVYTCNNKHIQEWENDDPQGGKYTGNPCFYAGCGLTIRPLEVKRKKYECTSCKWVGYYPADPGMNNQHCPRSACDGTLKGEFFSSKRPKLIMRCPGALKPKEESFEVASIGLPLGISIVEDETEDLWAHELGHTRYLEHAASAPGAKKAQHDSKKNNIVTWNQVSNLVFDSPHNLTLKVGKTVYLRVAPSESVKINDMVYWDKHAVGGINAANGIKIKVLQSAASSILTRDSELRYANRALAESHPDNCNWDRACIMSYIVLQNTYDEEKDKPFFCALCILKNRGWKLAGLANDLPAETTTDP